jgi:F-type H+-transporting ATPase subunit delta
MRNPRLAGRYAKSLMDIATEQNVVEPIYANMLGLQSMLAGSPDLLALLRSPIVKADKKQSIFKDIFGGKVHPITEKFTTLITSKSREKFLPEIITAFIEQYKINNQINTVKLTTAAPLSPEMQESILAQVQKVLVGKKIDLQTFVNESLIGGFILESNNTLFDATIARDLKDIQKQFLQNIYVPSLK